MIETSPAREDGLVGPAVEGHEGVAVLLGKPRHIARRGYGLRVVDDEDYALLLRDLEEEVLLEEGESLLRVIGEEVRVRKVGLAFPHRGEIFLPHLGRAEGDPARSVVEGYHVAVAEEDLGDVFLDLHEYELPLVHLVGEEVAYVAMHDVEVGGLGTVLCTRAPGPRPAGS